MGKAFHSSMSDCSSCSASSIATGATSDVIRSRLLNRLGIYRQGPNGTIRRNIIRTETTESKWIVPESSTHKELPHIQLSSFKQRYSFRLPLNDHEEFEARSLSSAESFSSNSTSTSRRSIHFDDDVVVHPIPSHRDYSYRIKQLIWSGSRELSYMATRNQVEFASEGYDWHRAIENEDMYVDANSGDLIHPVWMQFETSDSESDYEESDGADPFKGSHLERKPSFSADLQGIVLE